ncbi:GMC family oxidoreductase [Mucilaginibacter terrenus]|uniref:GMC family oxidoreductase n=1 Tax=Mucilaginibacter terrenus TaxID=2482727 RepID=A0A3E2NWN1_9SPHI|nr:GMC family oxidoreductase [Mucilaginibacter terrenus]RFZ85415.1 GMC family oxidoreductase [Mucilaginibacter terrenus]
MAFLNIDSVKERTFDAIVIGSGMSGSWAAKELGEKGLKTLVLERGRDVKHIKDYPTTNLYPWEFPHHGVIPEDVQKANPIVNRCYAFGEDAAHFFVKDAEHPYVQEKPFDWIRGYQVGGKSLLWARQTQRWSDFDFEGPARDGFAVDWPIRYKDIAPWYSHVEKFAGISGNRDGLPHLPDGEFLPAFPLNAVESYFSKHVKTKYSRDVISARCAHLSKPNPIHLQQGRAQCQERTLCQRGCPFGGYFSANSSTMPWALKTGNVTLRPFSVVESIIYNEKLGKATGVRVIDTNTKEAIDYHADVIFLNAAALNSNLVLLNSTSNRFPNGLGNDSGTLGKYVAFHNYSAHISAEVEGFEEWATDGRNPAGGGYIPRFRNLHKQETNFLRGYGAGLSAYRGRTSSGEGIGDELKQNLAKKDLGPWRVGSHMMGETIPKESNYVALDKSKKDPWGIPQLKISVDYDDNDAKMKADYLAQLTEMFTSAGFKNIKGESDHRAPGLDIHEMGGVRMGNDPKTSMLDKWHRLHACQNVYVTDGASMTSTSYQNPSLTYMAFAARAVDHYVGEKKKLNS